MNRLQDALGGVTAAQELKDRTRLRLAQELARSRPAPAKRPLLAACACLLCLLLGAGGWRLYSTPVSYISIDVNPSLELGLNVFDRVVETAAYNGEGRAVAAELSLQNQPYRQAVDAVLADPLFQSYLAQGDGVVFTVVSGDPARLQAGLETCSGYSACGGRTYPADAHCLNEAHANGLSVGKYRTYLELSQYEPGLTVEDCHHMSMGELQQRLEACHSHAAQDTQSSQNTQPAHGHGHGHGGWHG